MTHLERITPAGYEERYAEALEVVRSKLAGKTMCDPEFSPAGTRFVRIGAMLCNDQEVFRLAWGTETARDIVAQRWSPVR